MANWICLKKSVLARSPWRAWLSYYPMHVGNRQIERAAILHVINESGA